MFKWLKRKSKLKTLQNKYNDLLKESFELGNSSRVASDLKRAEAEDLLKEIDKLLDAETI